MRTVTVLRLAAALQMAIPCLPRLMCAQSDSPRLFPKVEVRNLEGRDLVFPNDFAGEVNVVLVAFQREQQRDVDTWTPALADLGKRVNGLHVYEMPTLSRAYRFARRMIDGGMAKGIKDRQVREATATAFIDKGPFKKALGIDSEDTIHAFVVRRDGTVTWHGRGPLAPQSLAALTAAVEALRPAAP
jgi:hypothetical protein